MATITSFQVDHPNALQHVVWTEKYLLVGTISGFLNILDLQCRHVGSLTSCEHRRTMQVTKSWGLDCCADVLATGGEDGKICLWNLRTGLLENTLTGHTGSITKISMIDSDTLISGSTDLNVIVWDIGTGQRRHILTGHAQPVRTLKQHKSLLLTGSDDGPIYVWNLEDGNCVRVLEGHDRLVWALNFNEDATLLAAGASLGKMRIWELATGVCTAQCEGHSKIINQFANIGRDELVTGAADGTIRFWNWKDGELLDTLHAHENAVTGFKLTEQHIISAGMDGKVCIWHRSDKSLYRDLRPKVSAVWKLAGRGNALVLVMRIEAGKHLVEIWDSSSL